MTRDPVGGRGVGAIDTIRRLDAGAILTIILVLGFALRVLIAGVLLPQSGLSNDVGAFTAWAHRMADGGPGQFYAEGYFADYPPGYMYVLWLIGLVGGALAPIVGQDATGGLVKLPGMAADVGVAWLLFVIARRWGGDLVDRARFRVRPEALGIAAATVYLFNPGVIFDSAVWGQIDAVGTLVLLAGVYALARGWTEVAAVAAVAAMLLKFQFAFLIPIVAIVGLKRHLVGRSSDPARADRRDPLRALTSLAAGIGSLALLMLPFGMSLYSPLPGGDPRGLLGILPAADPSTSLVGKLVEAANTYTGLSVNAFNLWRNPFSGLGDTLFWGDDTTVGIAIGGLSLTWQQVGAIGFAIAALLAFWVVARRDDLRGILLAALVLAIAFFVLPTRVHERYLFPALALAAPLLFAGRAWPWIYGALSLSFFANIYWVYTADWSFADYVVNPGVGGQPMPRDPVLAATLLSDWGIWFLSFGSVVLLGVVAWIALRAPLATPERAAELSPDPEQSAPIAASAATRRPSARTATLTSVPGWLRPNPADAYLREPSRRLDRRDALLILGLVAFALVFRLWRLDLPRSMHFDEVYHARSATEFLSSWQEGWDRDVYEWTHPMLAKYLIAAGIVMADPNAVVGATELDAVPVALAVAAERSSSGRDRSVTFAAVAPSTIVALDAESGEQLARWEAPGTIASLALDLHEPPRLLVGRADGGTIHAYELAGLLAAPDERAPPAGPPIETDLAAVLEITVPDGSTDPILVRGPDRIASVDHQTDAVLAAADGTYGGLAVVTATADEEEDQGEGDESGPRTLVAATDLARAAVVFLDGTTLQPRLDAEGDEEVGLLPVDVPLTGPIVARGSGDDQVLFALTGPLPATEEHAATTGGIAAVDADEERLIGLVPLPGSGALIGHQRVAGIVYVAGIAPDGSPELWAMEPHVESRGSGSIGLGTFDTTPLPGTPVTMAFDVASSAPGDDHGRLLVATASGSAGAAAGGASLVRVDAGSNAFAWRLAGIAFGAALVGFVYLLAATMFGRRRIAILAAAFVAVDGMSYVMSRIAMNDIFVATFIVAAYLAFWQVWSGRWARSAWWVMPLVGVLIGLAAATKWVGFYALAGLLVLVLARSDLGRLLLVALVALTAIVGGVGAPWPFLVVMLGITALALAVTWLRPLRIDAWEALTAIPASIVVLAGVSVALVLGYASVPDESARTPGGAVEYLFGLLARGAEAVWPVAIMVGVAAVLIGWRAWLSLRDPASDARWWRPGEMGGFAWSWAGACLVIVPLVVYGLSYVPYLQLGHDWTVGGGPNYGWSVEELHAQMFNYHFNLTAGHRSASPWWSWPLALKPTWFYVGNFDRDQVALIYNGGNPLLTWAGIPALGACAVLAWKRRSVALVLLVAAFAFQYVPWLRIERATFAYHYLTAVIFAMIAVAYVVDELLRRPAWRELAIGYLGMVVLVGIVLFPLGSALPMPDWYANFFRALPPWNYDFYFPDPPSGDRGDLVNTDALKAAIGMLVAMAAVAWALAGRDLVDRFGRGRRQPITAEGG